MITLDTSAVVAILDATEPWHDRVVAALRAERPPYLVPAGILAEIGYIAEHHLGAAALDALLGDLVDGAFTLECRPDDLTRVRDLTERYRDLPLGVADAVVIACAEQAGRRVLTVDRRDFDVVGRELGLTILP